VLNKSILNPIITAPTNLKWANKKVYNAAAIFFNNNYHLFFRAIGEDYISRIGHAISKDGERFEIYPEPVFEPVEKWENKGCEDPRITKIGDHYVMAYTAYDGLTARIALTTTTDFITWSPRTIAFPNWREGRWVDPSQKAWNKAAAIFPEKINGKYLLFFGDDNIWQAYSDDSINWTPVIKPVLEPRNGYFDSGYIEMGSPPILTKQGWLIIYHGIDSRKSNRIYRLGAVLVSREDPTKIIWRCSKPILEPTELYERIGQIDIIDGGMDRLKTTDEKELNKLSSKGKLPQAVFCCGAIVIDDEIKVYYSGSDTVLCLATGTLENIMES
jgi:predicted GH43/DUF377 family glycosyl hydrolase